MNTYTEWINANERANIRRTQEFEEVRKNALINANTQELVLELLKRMPADDQEKVKEVLKSVNIKEN